MKPQHPQEKTEDLPLPPGAADKDAEAKPGTNEVRHEPDPTAERLPDPEHKHVPRSPYTAGNY